MLTLWVLSLVPIINADPFYILDLGDVILEKYINIYNNY